MKNAKTINTNWYPTAHYLPNERNPVDVIIITNDVDIYKAIYLPSLKVFEVPSMENGTYKDKDIMAWCYRDEMFDQFID